MSQRESESVQIEQVARRDQLRQVFDKFLATLNAVTVPADNGGRKIVGAPHAAALSEVVRSLHNELGATLFELKQRQGRVQMSLPPGLRVEQSDSPDGPWTPVPASHVTSVAIPFGDDEATALLLAAMENAMQVTALPPERSQSARHRKNPRRFHSGDVLSAADLAKLESASKLLQLLVPQSDPVEAARSESVDSRHAIVLSERAAEVLRYLADQPTARPRTHIADNLPADRRSVRRAVNELIDRQLVVDRGRSTGIAILEAGRAWLEDAQSMS